jgi:hypothetical protein
MFFCHAWESMMREGRADPTRPPLAITCFERASAPGGVWNIPKGERKKNGSGSSSGPLVGMYSGLWTNGASHSTEFPDYTYLEHFGPDHPVTVYMRRSDLLSYMMGRVTKHCPDFVDKYMELETQVEHVHYNETTHKFEVTTTKLNQCSPPLPQSQQTQAITNTTTVTTTREFDKCIWACGENGRPYIPFALKNMFHTGGFRGAVLHASETGQLDFHVRHKRVLMVGGSYSAEDLAFQAIKLGVEQIYICCRDRDAPVTWTGAWPMDKVQILLEQTPFQITENGTCIELRNTTWMWPAAYKFEDTSSKGCHNNDKNKNNTTKLYDIDTVIFCTGYHTNMDMLEENLRIVYKDCSASGKNVITVPTDWKMKTPNVLSVLPGVDDIVPSLSSSSKSSSADANSPGQALYNMDFKTPDLFRGFLISNPNMMYIADFFSEVPLVACDVLSWLVVTYLCGHNVLPDATTMHKINHEESLRDLSLPFQRYCRDKAYHDAVDKAAAAAAPEVLMFPKDNLPNEQEEDDDDDDDSNALEEEKSDLTFSDSDLLGAIMAENYAYEFQLLASQMEEAQYPLNIGTIDELNEKGRALQTFDDLSYAHRDDRTKKELQRDPLKTFRDCDDSEKFYSLFTGTPAVPLKEKWLTMKEEEGIESTTNMTDLTNHATPFLCQEKFLSFSLSKDGEEKKEDTPN